jgi:hypothetical protein
LATPPLFSNSSLSSLQNPSRYFSDLLSSFFFLTAIYSTFRPPWVSFHESRRTKCLSQQNLLWKISNKWNSLLTTVSEKSPPCRSCGLWPFHHYIFSKFCNF